MCVEWMTSPSGNVMLRGLTALRLFAIGTFGRRKCAVAPESAMASVAPRVMLIHSWVVSVSFMDSMLDNDAVDAVASSELGERLLVMIVLSSSSSS